MAILNCGSVACHNMRVFKDSFRDHILPDQIHILNVAFLVPELRQEYGDHAANVAYKLKLLNQDPIVMATVGRDFDPYAQWLVQNGTRLDHIRVLDDALTPQAFITTDIDDNQITGVSHDLDWETSGRMASVCGSLKIRHHGTQNHRFTLQ